MVGLHCTTGFIDHDSPKYLERSSLGQRKVGVSGVTHASHILGCGVVNTILTHTPGRPLGDEGRRAVYQDLNSDANLRIKSVYGNVVLDERRDARIAQAFVEGETIYGRSTAQRAYLAYESARQMSSLDAVTRALGDMRIYNESTGRSHLLRNHHRYV